jgi:hypothetical protein
MHGLKPTDIDALTPLKGAEIVQICIGLYQIQFGFHPQGDVSVEGRCELIDSCGAVINAWDRGNRSEMFRFPELLHKRVVAVAIESTQSLLLTFEHGMAMRVIDNSKQYESFSVGNLFV